MDSISAFDLMMTKLRTLAPLTDEKFNDRTFKAIIVVVDLVNSAKIKSTKGFPPWVSVLKEFFHLASKKFTEKKLYPIKFLGDCLIFFYPFPRGEKTNKPYLNYLETTKWKMPRLRNASSILNICCNTRKLFWEAYKGQLQSSETGTKSNALQVTIAIDYGEVIDFNQEIEGLIPDPVGLPMDCCFRIQGIAGPNQVLMSKSFFDLLDSNTQGEIIPIAIDKESLKGIENQDHVYFAKPTKKEIDWILDEKNRSLIEESKPMIHKAKLKLLREKVKTLESQLKQRKSK